jgi:tRNA1Val (adenine37-N6)-methyltransferase
MNHYFQFRQFRINQERCAMKVSTDSCLFGAWVASRIPSGTSRILDIGAGTGLLSLMAAQCCDADIEAVEIEAGCFGQLKENIEGSPWTSRIRPVEADIRKYQAPAYDLIISNPPFYEQQLVSPDPGANAARHSTELGLGELLDVICRLRGLHGLAAILLPFYRKEELLTMAGKKGLYPSSIMDARHSPSHPWYRTMVMFSGQQQEPIRESISVRNTGGQYTDEFSALLEPYYLKR